jgi:hypothetical protein
MAVVFRAILYEGVLLADGGCPKKSADDLPENGFDRPGRVM